MLTEMLLLLVRVMMMKKSNDEDRLKSYLVVKDLSEYETLSGLIISIANLFIGEKPYVSIRLVKEDIEVVII